MAYTRTTWQNYPGNTPVNATRLNNMEQGLVDAHNFSVICTSSTRPASPFAGQVIYETDTTLRYVWNGTTWQALRKTGDSVATSLLTGSVPVANMPTGSVIQVVTRTDTTSQYSTGAFDSACYCYITPLLTTSRILVLVTASVKMNSLGSDVGMGWGIRSSAAGGLFYQTAHSTLYSGGGSEAQVLNVHHLHGPSRPSPTSNQYYQLYLKPYTNNSGTGINLNANYQGTDMSLMTLIEIA